jgi:uncharacterized protein YkwD
LKFGNDRTRSVSSDPGALASAPGRSRRAAGLIVVALVLMAAFVLVAPYLSSALKQGYQVFSQLGSSGSGIATETTTGITTTGNCSSAVTIQPLSAPDIMNGTANVAYPQNYCTLAEYALAQINADRAANGVGPVALGFNLAAQQHADSMLYYSYFSHYDTQGYAPYMRYSLLGGRGADFENVAYSTYGLGLFGQTAAIEGAIKNLEHLMVYDDSTCCNNGHRENILNPLHNFVSIGVAYNSTVVYFDEEFENEYINLNFTVASPSAPDPYYVTMQGDNIPGTPAPNSIYIAYDNTTAPENTTQLNDGPHEYGPGTLVGGVLPPSGLFGTCGQFTSGTTVCAGTWAFNPSSTTIAFSLEDFVKNYGPGVYTVYLITGSDTDSALTTISVFVT